METVKDNLLLSLDAAIGFRMVSGDARSRTCATALTWAAEVVSLLPEDHPLFGKLALASDVGGEHWGERERNLLARWGAYNEVMDTGLMFVVELAALADKFMEE